MLNHSNRYINIFFYVLILYVAYNIIWPIFGLGVTTLIQTSLLLLLIVGLMSYVLKHRKRKNTWVNFLIIIWITQVLAFFIVGSSSTTQFKESTFILLVAAPIVSSSFNPKTVKHYIIIMSIVSILSFFVMFAMIRSESENGYGAGYLALVTLPVFLYFARSKSRLIQMFICMIILALVLVSMKRGDILACIISILVFYLISDRKSIGSNLKRLMSLVLIVIVGYFFFQYLLSTSDVFAFKLQQTLDGDTSGRDVIYTSLINHFIDAPLHVQLFGGGFDATVQIAGARAHSDILEVLSCEGIFGLLIYISAYIALFVQMIKLSNSYEKAIIAMILAIWFVKMFVSMFIFSQSTIILFVLAGYILNRINDKRYEC